MMKKIFFLCFTILVYCSLNAQKSLDSLLTELRKANSDSIRCELLNQVLVNYEFSGKPDEAEIYYKKLELLAFKIKSNVAIGNCYNYLGRKKYYKSEYDSALTYFKKSAICFENANYSLGISSSRNNIAAIYSEKGMFNKSIKEHRKLVTFNQKNKNYTQLGSSYANLGFCYKELYLLDSALFYYIKSSKLYEEINWKNALGGNYFNIANIYNNQAKPLKALEYLDLIKKNQLQLVKATANRVPSVYAISYLHLNKLDSAKKYAERAIKMCESSDDPASLIQAYGSLAEILTKEKKYSLAIDYFLKANKIAQENELDYIIGNNNFLIAGVYSKQNNFKEAINYYNLSNKFQLENKTYLQLIDNLKGLSQVYGNQGDYKNQALMLDSILKVKDKINELSMIENMSEIEEKYQSEKKQALLDKTNLELNLESEKNKQKSTIIIIGAIALLATLFFALMAIINFNKAKKANEKIVQQKEELEGKQKEILDSIRYAKRIQTALLPNNKYIEKKLNK